MWAFGFLITLFLFPNPLLAAMQCTTETFTNVTLFGANILSLSASYLTNISDPSPLAFNAIPAPVTNLSVCEVQIQYTHPGQNDTINVVVWLPKDGWNGRFLATGGAGFSTGVGTPQLVWPAHLGFSTAYTDGGHILDSFSAAKWALASPGNVNWNLLEDFAAVALNDLSTLGKAATGAFYGSPPKYSYWNGCSTGGRQGHMLAQRYPTQFDGILATAPALNWAQFIVSEYWPQLVMNLLGKYPRQCELNAITQAATEACDGLDGVKDGIIVATSACKFDPHVMVGHKFNCSETGTVEQISSAAAEVALASWTGPSTVDQKFLWFGVSLDAPLSGLANTTCDQHGNCSGVPFPIAIDWIKYFVLKDPEFTFGNLSHRDFDTIWRQSNDQFDSIIGTRNPDLTDFRDAGGKMITWHGLADPLIPPKGTYDYYQRALELDPNVADYYRFFPAPGLNHCGGGPGWFPGEGFQSLVDWVEKGIPPDTLEGRSVPTEDGTIREVSLCPFPQQLTYKGGDINKKSSFICKRPGKPHKTEL